MKRYAIPTIQGDLRINATKHRFTRNGSLELTNGTDVTVITQDTLEDAVIVYDLSGQATEVLIPVGLVWVCVENQDYNKA